MSIGKIAVGQHRYYEGAGRAGRDDYYSGRGEAPGEWIGRGARSLGLQGGASGAQFNALIAALDLTFSAPKSVSVLAALAPQRVGGALIAAHAEAVASALSYLEDTAVQVRRGHGGERVEAGEGLIAVAYHHWMSRALDPQLLRTSSRRT